jgi:hypothetical protein
MTSDISVIVISGGPIYKPVEGSAMWKLLACAFVLAVVVTILAESVLKFLGLSPSGQEGEKDEHAPEV